VQEKAASEKLVAMMGEQREAEKQKKKEAKEAAKHLKIWDKKTATSRMPLRRVKDSDIAPI